jgi:hypothetical protein
MDQATPSTASTNTLHCALELSKTSWLLAIQFPDREQPSLTGTPHCRHDHVLLSRAQRLTSQQNTERLRV